MPNNRNKQPQANNSSGPLTSSSGNELQFQFLPEQDIHVEMIAGEPWFLAKDVCDALGIANAKDAVSRLKDYQKLTFKVLRAGTSKDDSLGSVSPTSGQGRNMNFVNESGLYSLIFKSIKPEAEAFQKWVTTEVLPSIRKYGMYCSGLEGVERVEENGTKYYKYSEVLTLLGRRKGGSNYLPTKKWTAQFIECADGIYASEQYVLILLQRNSIKSLFEPIKADQKVYDSMQLSLFNEESQGGNDASSN